MKEESHTTYSNYAFISYSHHDMRVARWLQRRLESFKLPAEIHGVRDVRSSGRYLRPVFRDQSDLNTGILADELRKNLEDSKFLIIICSRASASSSWVSAEAQAFVEMGRLDRIIPVMVSDGQTPEPKLFPQYLREYFVTHHDSEILGVNIGEVGREKALVRVVSRMLDVSFDSLWKRHQRMRRQHWAMGITIAVFAVALAYLFALPVTVDVTAIMERSELPVGKNITMIIDDARYTIPYDGKVCFEPLKLSGHKRFGSIHLQLKSRYYKDIDTTVAIGLWTHRDINIAMSRDETFAVFAGTVYDSDMRAVSGVSVTIGTNRTVTDDNGHFRISVPLPSQRPQLPLRLEKSGYTVTERADEVPGTELKLIIRKK